MIRSVPGRTPRIHPDTWIDPAAQVIGDIVIEAGASIWPGTIVRGDQDNNVKVGRNTNVQDCSVLHVTPEFPCVVGDGVTIGHRAVVHACTVMDHCRIGIGAVVLDGPSSRKARRWARARWCRRAMSPEEVEDILRNATDYVELWRRDYGEARSTRSGPTRGSGKP